MRKMATLLGMTGTKLHPECDAPNCILHTKDNLPQLTQKRLKLEQEGYLPFCENCIEQGRIHLKKMFEQDRKSYERFEKMRKMRKIETK